MSETRDAMRPILERAPVIPVLVVESAETAVPLAKALLAGGLPVLEITLRSDAALDAIRAIGRDCPDAVVGAGTLREPAQIRAVVEAGARFMVSPGATEDLLVAAEASTLPYLPGAATASEVMGLLGRGYRCMKFFPAEAAGGTEFLRALAAPLPEARFCPTGGIDARRAGDYLALSNVISVGGSWVAPADGVRARDWSRITALARAAAALTGAKAPIDDPR